MTALTVRDVHKQFHSVEVLKSINLEIDSGDFIVLVGPSGCGKSTLLNIIAGLESQTSGNILIDERPVDDVPSKDRNIAMVFQSYALYPSMTVRQNITFGMECRKVPRAQRNEAVARIARLLQIETLLDRKPAQLSGGQRQRVAMGRALVRDPLLFLFDEPLSNLDAQLRAEMRIEIKQLHQRLGSTIVYVTHDQIEAMTLATRIAVMKQGVIQQFADPETVYDRPVNLFVARFMGAPPMNTVAARLETNDGKAVAVIGRDDMAIRFPVPVEAASWSGREVVLGIRPECIAEPTRQFSDVPGAVTTIAAPVEMIEPTGAETIVVLRLGDERALGRVSPDLRPRLGERAVFAVDTRKISLFNPASGDRIT